MDVTVGTLTNNILVRYCFLNNKLIKSYFGQDWGFSKTIEMKIWIRFYSLVFICFIWYNDTTQRSTCLFTWHKSVNIIKLNRYIHTNAKISLMIENHTKRCLSLFSPRYDHCHVIVIVILI